MDKMYDLKIVDVLVQMFKENDPQLLRDVDEFEEKLNMYAPDMMDECYLMVEAAKCGIFNIILLNPSGSDNKTLVDFLTKRVKVSIHEAVFIIGVISQVVESFDIKMRIVMPDVDQNEQLVKVRKRMDAVSYFEGRGVDQDYEQAYQLFSEVYEDGDYTVLGYLGYLLENGYGIEEDLDLAITYYERGAINQDDYCMYHLGLCYEEGKGKTKDIEMAKKYLKQCHINEAYRELGHIYDDEGMYGEAFQSYLKAAHNYDGDALYIVGMRYFNALGTTKNLDQAIESLTYASYLNQSQALCQLGIMMLRGIGFKDSQEKGLAFIRKSADLNCGDAYLTLAKLYETGQYVEKDIHQSIVYYQKAIDLNNGITLDTMEYDDEVV